MMGTDHEPNAGTIPFVEGSDTSEAAGRSIVQRERTDEQRVLQYIVSKGPYGATDWELERDLRMKHQTASARRKGLVIKHLVCDSGMRRPTNSKRMATVWIAGAGDSLVGAPNDRATRPTKDELQAALECFKKLADHSRATGGPAVIDEVQKVGRWLKWIARRGT
jgi:hypothetical protein